MITRLVAIGCLLIVLGPVKASGQDAKAPIGVWERVADVAADGRETPPAGALAVLIFSEDGYWAGVGGATADARGKLHIRAQRGTYKVDGTTLIRPVVSASDPNPAPVGTDLIREFRVEGDILTLNVPGSKAYARWHRVIR